MSNQQTEFLVPEGEPVIEVRRFVKAPPSVVFTAWTEPEHLRKWWGPHGFDIIECEVDLRVGGGYRMVQRAPSGDEYAFHGTYRTIEPPHLLVSTFVFEGTPDAEAVDTITLEAVDGGTAVHIHSLHDSVAARDFHVAAGMEAGMAETLERLDELVAALVGA